MKAIKKVLNNIFIDGLSGMALGLFSTLIIGTILKQIGDLMGGTYGTYLSAFAVVAQRLTGAGIGIGVAYKFRESTYVLLSAAAAGMIGAYASNLIAGTLLSDTGALVLSGPGEPLGAFVAAYVGITIGRLVAGKTKLDLLITPAITILSGGAVGILVGPGVSSFMTWLGNLVNWGTEQQPILMGIVVSVIMGMVLTLPISSAALGIILGLNGVAAGAATIGCCCQMIGFAVTSFKDNGVGGLFAQGIGTSMLQIPNIMKRPLIWLPPTLASAILGPIAIIGPFHMTNNATGAGIGIGVAYKFRESTYVLLSAAAAGMIGAYASNLIAGTLLSDTGALVLSGPGEPLGAFVAAYVGITIGRLVAGKTKLDLLITPAITILSGGAVGILVGPGVSSFMTWLGNLVNWGTEQQPILMGIVVSVIMGMVLTLPISSAALGIILGLNGVAAGAATIGCCCQMIGFAVTSFKDNGVGGLFAQGIGTSMLQIPNIMKRPLIWLPPTLASAILGPIAIIGPFHMTNNATGSGMGTSGLVGQIMTYQTMVATESPVLVILKIVLFHFLLPGLLSYVIYRGMRNMGYIKDGQMKLNV